MQGSDPGFSRRIIVAIQTEFFLGRGQESRLIGPVSGMTDRALSLCEGSMDLRESPLVRLIPVAGDAQLRFGVDEQVRVVSPVRLMTTAAGTGRIGMVKPGVFLPVILVAIQANRGLPIPEEMQLG